MVKEKPLCFVVTGPTASGKSAYAMKLASNCNGVIINADVMQLYTPFPILTAQPTEADRNQCPHTLYGVLPPGEWCNAHKWRQMALAQIENASANGQTPIITGGTGFYLLALLNGIAELPAVPPAIRQELIVRLGHEGHEKLHSELSAADPISAAKIKINDTQRLIRALEVYHATQKPLSQFHAEQTSVRNTDYNFNVHILLPERQRLYSHINQRVLTMLDLGALDEIKADPGIHSDWPTYKTHGYREFSAFLRGDISLEIAIDETQKVTRHYAKRQMTWARQQMTSEKLGAPVKIMVS